MSRIQLVAVGLEFEEDGNTIWVQGPCGTLLRIKCSGRILVKRCSAPGAHADALVAGDIAFCVPAGSDEEAPDVGQVEVGAAEKRRSVLSEESL